MNPLDLAPQYVAPLTGIVRLGTIGSVLCTAVTGHLTGDTSHVSRQCSFIIIILSPLHDTEVGLHRIHVFLRV